MCYVPAAGGALGADNAFGYSLSDLKYDGAVDARTPAQQTVGLRGGGGGGGGGEGGRGDDHV